MQTTVRLRHENDQPPRRNRDHAVTKEKFERLQRTIMDRTLMAQMARTALADQPADASGPLIEMARTGVEVYQREVEEAWAELAEAAVRRDRQPSTAPNAAGRVIRPAGTRKAS